MLPICRHVGAGTLNAPMAINTSPNRGHSPITNHNLPARQSHAAHPAAKPLPRFSFGARPLGAMGQARGNLSFEPLLFSNHRMHHLDLTHPKGLLTQPCPFQNFV